MNTDFIVTSLRNAHAVIVMHYETVDAFIKSGQPHDSDHYALRDALDEAQAQVAAAIRIAESAYATPS